MICADFVDASVRFGALVSLLNNVPVSVIEQIVDRVSSERIGLS